MIDKYVVDYLEGELKPSNKLEEEAKNIAIHSVQMRIPNPPKNFYDEDGCKGDYCPSCGEEFYDWYCYCPNCGQAIYYPIFDADARAEYEIPRRRDGEHE